MNVIRVGWGEAPDTADRVFIERRPGGLFSWSGTVGRGNSALFTTGNGTFRSAREAEAAALSWAELQGVTEVMIETEDTHSPL